MLKPPCATPGQAPAGLPTFDYRLPSVVDRLALGVEASRVLLGAGAAPISQPVRFVSAAPRRRFELAAPTAKFAGIGFRMVFYSGWATMRNELGLGKGCVLRLAWDAAAGEMHIAKLPDGGSDSGNDSDSKPASDSEEADSVISGPAVEPPPSTYPVSTNSLAHIWRDAERVCTQSTHRTCQSTCIL